MSPLRIIIIAILIYLAFRLITGGPKKKSAEGGQKSKSSGKMPVSDTLEEDPVCGKLVPRQQAVEHQHQGKIYYFCSNECCKEFRTQQGE